MFNRFSIPPVLWFSGSLKFRNSGTLLHSYITTQLLRFLCKSLTSLFLSFSLFSSCFSTFPEFQTPLLWKSELQTLFLRFSASPEFRSCRELFNLHFLYLGSCFILHFHFHRSQKDPVFQLPLVSLSLTCIQVYLSVISLVGIPNLFS